MQQDHQKINNAKSDVSRWKVDPAACFNQHHEGQGQLSTSKWGSTYTRNYTAARLHY